MPRGKPLVQPEYKTKATWLGSCSFCRYPSGGRVLPLPLVTPIVHEVLKPEIRNASNGEFSVDDVHFISIARNCRGGGGMPYRSGYDTVKVRRYELDCKYCYK
jgi:hypothetical protein